MISSTAMSSASKWALKSQFILRLMVLESPCKTAPLPDLPSVETLKASSWTQLRVSKDSCFRCLG